jgi:hypothetical protein
VDLVSSGPLQLQPNKSTAEDAVLGGPRHGCGVGWLLAGAAARHRRLAAAQPALATAKGNPCIRWNGAPIFGHRSTSYAQGGETFFPDSDSEHMFGANAMNPSLRPPAARAGYSQGRALAARLTEFWR